MTILKVEHFYLLITFSLTNAQNDPNCGTKGPVQLKIVGGVEAKPNEFPWAASLGYYGALGKYQHYCTGSIIHRQFILTAAHCAPLMENPSPSVMVAVHNVSDNAQEEGGKVSVPIARYINHPQYTPKGKYATNDVALVKLTSPLNITTAKSSHIKIICVPEQDSTWNPYQGTDQPLATAVGWGMTNGSDETSYSAVLRKITVPFADMNWCPQAYGLTNDTAGLNSMICTFQQGKATCNADSGGPLMMKPKGSADVGGDRWTVVGVTSWGNDLCGEGVYPDMYAHVSLFSDWIWKTVKENSG